jgi:hypothetical protein
MIVVYSACKNFIFTDRSCENFNAISLSQECNAFAMLSDCVWLVPNTFDQDGNYIL